MGGEVKGGKRGGKIEVCGQKEEGEEGMEEGVKEGREAGRGSKGEKWGGRHAVNIIREIET